jgi:hypothetical protein
VQEIGHRIHPSIEMIVVRYTCTKHIVERLSEEIAILKIAQHQQVIDDGKYQKSQLGGFFGSAMDRKADEIIDHSRGEQQYKKETARLVIEEDARQKQKGIAGQTMRVDHRKHRQHSSIKSPKEKLREQQGCLEIQSKYVAQQFQCMGPYF